MRGLAMMTATTVLGLSVDALAQMPTDAGSARRHRAAAHNAHKSAQQRPPEAITVFAARRPPVSGGALGNRRDLDTPFSARIVTAAELQERQVKSLSRIFSEDASTVSNGDTYSFNSYSITIRGIVLDDYNSYKINGSPFYMTTVELPLESFDSVQLLKGASGFMYGFNAPGGLINYVTKRPTDRRMLTVDAGYSSDGVDSEHVDTGGRLFDDVIGYRINGTHEQGETYSGSYLQRDSGSIGLDARLTDNLLWTGDALYQYRRVKGGVQDFYIADPGSYTDGALPKPITGDTNLTAYPDTFFNSRVLYLSNGLRWTPSPNWTFHTDASLSRDWREYKAEWMPLSDNLGNYQVGIDTDPRSWFTYDAFEAIGEGRFDTWLVHHQLVFGSSWQGLQKFLPFNYFDQQIIGTEDLYAPVTHYDYPTPLDKSVFRSFRSDQEGVFASDTISLGPTWSLLGGLRFTDYDELDNDGAGTSTEYTETPLTPVAALLYHPWHDTIVYFSYVQALQSGQVVGDTYINARQTLPAVLSDQVEAGLKIERPQWALSGAVYRINEGAQYATAADIYVSDGNEQFDGIEWNGHVDLPAGLTLTNSFSLERAHYQQAAPGIQGKNVEGVPGVQDNLQLTENLASIPGLSGTAEVHHTAPFWGDDFNTYHIPGTTLLNLRASYVFRLDHRTIKLRAEVDNVTDLHYWGFLASDYFFVGTPRVVFLNASVSL